VRLAEQRLPDPGGVMHAQRRRLGMARRTAAPRRSRRRCREPPCCRSARSRPSARISGGVVPAPVRWLDRWPAPDQRLVAHATAGPRIGIEFAGQPNRRATMTGAVEMKSAIGARPS
jgi:hypothetical protein